MPGRRDAGLLPDDAPRVDPAAVALCGVRDVEGRESVLLETSGVARIDRPGQLADALAGRAVFVHLDLDILDPSVIPSPFPAPGGLSDGGLRMLLAEIAEACAIVGCEITGFHDPSLVETIATVVDPLVAAA